MAQASKLVAERKFDQAVALCTEALSKAEKASNSKGSARALKVMGDAHAGAGRLQMAVGSYEKARAAYSKDKDTFGCAETDLATALAYEATDLDKTLDFAEQALQGFAEAGSAEWTAATLTVIGSAHGGAGRRQNAMDCYEKAVELAAAIGSTTVEGEALSRLGEEHEVVAQFVKAIDYYQRAWDVARKAGDKRAESLRMMSLGIVSQRIGQLRIAFSYFENALSLLKDLGDPRLTAAAVQNLASCHLADGRLAEARAWIGEALVLHAQNGDKMGEAGCLGTLGNIARQEGSFSAAEEALTKSARLFKEAGDKEGEATAYDSLGGVKLDQGDIEGAIVEFDRAIKVYTELRADSLLATSYGNKAEGLFQLGKYSEAEKCFVQAIDRYEFVRAGLGALSDAKGSYLNRRVHVYQQFAAVLTLQGKPDEAFDTVQKTKARSLLDLLASGQLLANEGMSEQERQTERALRERSDALNARMVKEGVENEVGAKARYAALAEELRKTEDELTKFTTNLLAKRPGLAGKRVAKTATVIDCGLAIPDDTALVEFLCSDDSVVSLVLRKVNGVVTINGHSMAFPSGQIEKRCTEFKRACSTPSGDYQALATGLYDDLIKPLERDLEGKKRVIICPDAYLWDLPFAALKPSATSFLADRFEIDYSYSATGALAALSGSVAASKAPKEILVCANPDFGSSTRFDDLVRVPGLRPIDRPSRPIDQPSRPIDQPSRPIDQPSRPIDQPSRPIDQPSRPIDQPSRAIDSLARGLTADLARGAVIAPLPGTQTEADGLVRLFNNPTVVSGSDVQESKIKAEMGQYRYIHFATHGFLNDTAPLLSSVVMAQPEQGSGEDGFLTARELFSLRLDADMVVLSACNSARGEVRSGEGIVGLTWALFVAGCKSQVVSQWSVDDASTARLMVDFYRNLTTGKQPKGAALSNAMRNLRSDAKTNHPYYWSPFILVGDWR